MMEKHHLEGTFHLRENYVFPNAFLHDVHGNVHDVYGCILAYVGFTYRLRIPYVIATCPQYSPKNTKNALEKLPKVS